MESDDLVSVRYMVDDVEQALSFYTTHFGFTVRTNALPAFADVVRGRLRVLLSGPASSAGRPMPDGRGPAARAGSGGGGRAAGGPPGSPTAASRSGAGEPGPP